MDGGGPSAVDATRTSEAGLDADAGARSDGSTAVDASCVPAGCTGPAYAWDRTLGSDGGDYALLVKMDLAIGPTGNVVLSGTFDRTVEFGGGPRTAVGEADAFVVSYGAGGGHRWDRTFGGGGWDRVQAVAVDDAANVFAVGAYTGDADLGGGFRRSAGGTDGLIVSYAPDGTYRWDRTFGAEGDDEAKDVAIDPAGNVVATGRFAGTVDLGGGERTSEGEQSGFVVSYAPDGRHRWDRATVRSDFVATDPGGNLLLAGNFMGTRDFGGGPRFSGDRSSSFVASYGPTGAYRWDRVAHRTAITGFATDRQGNVTIAGIQYGTADLGGGPRTCPEAAARCHDVLVASYDEDGRYRWDRTFGAPDEDWATDVAVNARDEVVVTGLFYGADFGGGPRAATRFWDAFVASYDAHGRYLWDMQLAGGGNDWSGAVATRGSSELVVAGVYEDSIDLGGGTRPAAGGTDAFVVKLTCACGP